MNIKQQRGYIGSWGFILLMLALSVGLYLDSKSEREEKIRSLRSNTPVMSADTARLLDEYKAKPSPTVNLNGMYHGSIRSDGNTISISYYFGSDSMLTKTATIDAAELQGSAKYSLHGSVLIYSEIEGDKGLFYTQGEAFSVEAENMLLFPSPKLPFELVRDDG